MNKLLQKVARIFLGLSMATGVGVAVGSNSKEAKPVHAAGSSDWVQVTALSGLNTTDTYVITNDADKGYYMNGTVSSGHFQSTAFSASAPASATAAGAFKLEAIDASNNIYKIKLVSTSKYVYATKAASGGGSVTGSSDSSGWKFLLSGTSFNAIYQTAYSSKYAAMRCYSNTSWRTYSNNSATSISTTSGTVFRLYKYQSKTLSSITLGGTYDTEFTVGDTFNHTGMTVTANYSDSTTATVTGSATWSSPDMSTSGTKQVTVSYTEGGTTKTATYNINVNAAGTTYTVTNSVSNATLSSSASVAENDPLNITIIPGSHWVLPTSLTSVTMGGNTLTAGSGYTYNSSTGAFSIASVSGNVVITGACTAEPSYSVTYVAGDHGSGSNYVVSNQYAGSYTLATFATAGFSADSGYAFKKWSVGGVEYAEGASITISGATTVTAVYEEVTTYTIVTDASTLTEGTTFVLVSYQSSTYYVSSGLNGTHAKLISKTSATTISGLTSGSTLVSTEAEVFTLKGNSSAWKIKYGSSFLKFTGNSNGNDSFDTEANASTFTAEITNDGYIWFTCTSTTGNGRVWRAGTGATKDMRNYATNSGVSDAYMFACINEAETYHVTYNGNGATSGDVPEDNTAYTSGQTVTVLGNTGNLGILGYTFSGWNTSDDGTGTPYGAGDTFDISADTELFAQWAVDASTYHVTYNANTASSGTVPSDNTDYASGSSVTVLGNTGNLAKTGYTFVGWNTAQDGTGSNYVAGNTFNIYSNTTLYAQWLDNSGGELLSWSRSSTTDTYTTGYTFISQAESKSGYYQDGGSAGDTRGVILYRNSSPIMSVAPTAISITATLGGGSESNLATPVYACYVNSSGEIIANTSVELTSTITSTGGSEFSAYLSASGITSAYGVMVYHVKASGYNVRYYDFTVSYSNETIYTITYEANGGTGTMSPTSNTDPEVASCTFTKEGYTFERWNTQADGEGTDYAVGAKPGANITLHAIWQENIEPIGGNVTMDGVTSATVATVNGHSAIKCGASNSAGSMTLTLNEANITKIKVYIAGWKGDTNHTINVSIDNSATISVSSITVTSDDGINTGTPFTLDGEETDYKFEFTISANAPAGTVITLEAANSSKNRFVAWGATDLFAETFASEFMTNLTCNAQGTSAPEFAQGYSWSTFEGLYLGLDAEEQGRLHDALANEGGSQIEQAMARYDYIEGKYNPTNSQSSPWKNFIGRTVTPRSGVNFALLTIFNNQNTNTVAIIVIISMVSVTAIGGYFFLRKRKENI